MIRVELDAKALASIIGGDSEVELHLRKQIVNEFTKRHLVELTKDAMFKDLQHQITLEIREILRRDYAVIESGIIRASLQTARQGALSRAIEQIIPNLVEDLFSKWVSEHFESVSQRIERRTEALLEAQFRTNIQRRIDEGIKQALDTARTTLNQKDKAT